MCPLKREQAMQVSNTLTHSRLYCREGEKVGHELTALTFQKDNQQLFKSAHKFLMLICQLSPPPEQRETKSPGMV